MKWRIINYCTWWALSGGSVHSFSYASIGAMCKSKTKLISVTAILNVDYPSKDFSCISVRLIILMEVVYGDFCSVRTS